MKKNKIALNNAGNGMESMEALSSNVCRQTTDLLLWIFSRNNPTVSHRDLLFFSPLSE